VTVGFDFENGLSDANREPVGLLHPVVVSTMEPVSKVASRIRRLFLERFTTLISQLMDLATTFCLGISSTGMNSSGYVNRRDQIDNSSFDPADGK
jgi:hypothetical protein